MSSAGQSLRQLQGAISDCGRGEGSPALGLPLCFTWMAREIPKAVAQSHVVSQLRRRPFASCVVEREKAARFPLAEGYPRTEARVTCHAAFTKQWDV